MWDGGISGGQDLCFQGAAKSNPAYFVNRVAEALTAALGSTWISTLSLRIAKDLRNSELWDQTAKSIATPIIKRLQCQSSPLPGRSGQRFQPVQLSHRVSGKSFGSLRSLLEAHLT